jgi:hypothetical protein
MNGGRNEKPAGVSENECRTTTNLDQRELYDVQLHQDQRPVRTHDILDRFLAPQK